MKKLNFVVIFISAAVLLLTQGLAAQPPAHELRLQIDPVKSGANIALTGNFHTVEGSFVLKHGDIRYDPATGKAKRRDRV